MSFIPPLPAKPQAWLLNSPLAPHLDAFGAHLVDGGYSVQTIRNHFLGVAHFARWMTQCALPVSLLDAQLLRQFLDVHLSHCSCPPPAVSDPSKHRSSLGHLMVVLRKLGVVAEVPPAIGPIPDELRRFDEHMRDARGLSEGTRRGCMRFVQRLLLHKFAGEELVFAKLQPEDLRKFIAVQMDLLGSVSNAMSLASALRTYFRYRTICGDPVHGLLGVISAPAHWRLASLPQALRPDEVDRLLASFDSSVPSPLRSYAIADVLRHRSLNTSLIYAKLDTPRLAAVALAWPGSTT